MKGFSVELILGSSVAMGTDVAAFGAVNIGFGHPLAAHATLGLPVFISIQCERG